MLKAPRVLILAVWMLLPVAGYGARPSPCPSARPIAKATQPIAISATIEPTLPLLIDMRLVGVQRGAGTARGRLEVELLAGDDLRDLELTLSLPDGLQISDGSALPRGPQDVPRGERRLLVFPLTAPDSRDLPIRIKATFRTADGRAFELGQGVTLEVPKVAGCSRAGAWEVMAVPLEGLSR